MATYRSPGVYVEEISTFPPSIAEVESAVPAFVGYTATATNLLTDDLLNVPTQINSMADYVQFFGGPAPEDPSIATITIDEQRSGTKTTGYTSQISIDSTKTSNYILYQAVQLYFLNNGTRCYVVSVGKHSAKKFQESDFETGFTLIGSLDDPTILLCPEGALLGQGDLDSLNQVMIEQAATLKDRFAIIDTVKPTMPKKPGTVTADTGAAINNIPADTLVRQYGAIYYPWLETKYNYNFTFGDLKIAAYTINGAAPGAGDTDLTNKTMSDPAISSTLSNYITGQLKNNHILLPPSSAIAGIYCGVDQSRGEWKAPANVSVNGVVKAVVTVARAEQDLINIYDQTGKSVNAILNSPGWGTLVMGARTLDGNDDNWKYINVRRLFITVEQSIKNSMATFVFEPNVAATWVKVNSMITNYLTLKWKDGALAGAKPEQAFTVSVGLGSTMTSVDILEGRLIVQIGMAVARPAEFIVLRFEQMLQTS